MSKETYAASGVQVEKAEAFVSRIKENAKRSEHARLWKGAGGYAAVYPLNSELAVAATTDGVGTKLLVAEHLQKFEGLGIDLVAMCANDLICVGARPSLFLDYYAVGELDDALSDALIKGIVEGCDRAGMILAGGETAEMPGLYQKGHFDLAGFAVGSLNKSQLISGDEIRPGQSLIGVASTGIHSNGLSLARKVMAKDNWDLLIEPTAIYVKPVLESLEKYPSQIKGIAHITGGGWRNLLRLNSACGFKIIDPLPIPEVFSLISQSVEEKEMYKTFNMGMGLALIAENSATEAIIDIFRASGQQAKRVGEVNAKALSVEFSYLDFVIKDKQSK